MKYFFYVSTNTNVVKLNIFPVSAMEACGTAPFFCVCPACPLVLNLCTRWGGVLSITPRPLYPQGNNRWYLLNRRLDGPPELVWPRYEREKSVPTIESRFFGCPASLTREDGTDTLSRNVGRLLPHDAVY